MGRTNSLILKVKRKCLTQFYSYSMDSPFEQCFSVRCSTMPHFTWTHQLNSLKLSTKSVSEKKKKAIKKILCEKKNIYYFHFLYKSQLIELPHT